MAKTKIVVDFGTPEELADLLWDLLREHRKGSIIGMEADLDNSGFEVRTADGRELRVTVRSAEEGR